MFNHKRCFTALLALILVQLSACKKEDDLLQIGCKEMQKPQDTYIYPVRPGTPEWSNLTSADEHLRVCQIPDNILPNISTEGLIQSWLDFPLANEILLANSIQLGVEFFMENFSGLKELCTRKNAGEKLYERYQQMNPACITTKRSITDKGNYTFSFTYIEMLLGQDTILNKITIAEKKILVSEAANKYTSKNNYTDDFGPFGTATSLFVCGKAMQNSQYQPFLAEIDNSPFLKSFLTYLLLPAEKEQVSQLMTTILNHSSNFTK